MVHQRVNLPGVSYCWESISPGYHSSVSPSPQSLRPRGVTHGPGESTANSSKVQMFAQALIKRDNVLLAQPQTNFLIYSEVAIIQTNMLDNFSKYIRLNHHCTSECIRKFVWVCANSVDSYSTNKVLHFAFWSSRSKNCFTPRCMIPRGMSF